MQDVIIILGVVRLAMFFVAVVLLVGGLRRRFEPCEPRCSACGFDLRGLSVRAGDEGSRCPECGQELCFPGRVLRQRTARSWRQVGIGIAIIATVFLPSIVGMFAGFTGNPEGLTPQWVLAQRVRQADYPAARELVRRMADGRASRRIIEQVVEDGLAWQAWRADDESKSVSLLSFATSTTEDLRGSVWQLLLGSAAEHGYAGHEQVTRFLAESLVVEVHALGEREFMVRAVVVLGPMAGRQVILEVEDVAGGAVQAHSLSRQSSWNVAVVNATITSPAGSRCAHLRWRLEAGAVWQYFAGEGDGVSGEVKIELPVEGDFPTLLRQWRPLGP